MIAHLVLFRFKPGIAPDSEAAHALHAQMLALPAQISEIRDWRCGFNTTPDADAEDYALYATFETRDALHRYFEHPAHLRLVESISPLVDLKFVDIGSVD
ncbi:Dabb family protein [Uliginosibacterium sediminicola]|uniref:Dabb family protein n=1 Tax=Uliginosibacterium sediminicola TaxID=2024550 RepID=A0ABU9Z408_9RHOO